MSAKIVDLSTRPDPIGHFVRLGGTGHRQLEALHGSGKLQIDRVVVDAASFKVQSDLIGALRNSGTEITLDTRIAELSEIGSYVQSGQWLVCADRSRPMRPTDFLPNQSQQMVEEIAAFAINNKVDAVLVPSHFANDVRNPWWPIDKRLCQDLRRALDEMGGRHIRTDYSLITTYRSVRESEQRRAFLTELQDLPFDNLWLRISGFGADATPTAVRRYISAVAEFHALRRPLVADHVGGLAGLAVLAFGAAGAIAHGVSEKERFDVRRWLAPRKDGGGGQSGRVYVTGLDRHFKIKEARALLDVRGARRLLACPDPNCCPLGVEDTFKNPKNHFINQRISQVTDLSRVYESRRVERFLRYHLTEADRCARQATRLNPDDQLLARVLRENSERLDDMRAILEDLQQTIGNDYSRSRVPRRRDAQRAVSRQNG